MAHIENINEVFKSIYFLLKMIVIFVLKLDILNSLSKNYLYGVS